MDSSDSVEWFKSARMIVAGMGSASVRGTIPR